MNQKYSLGYYIIRRKRLLCYTSEILRFWGLFVIAANINYITVLFIVKILFLKAYIIFKISMIMNIL